MGCLSNLIPCFSRKKPKPQSDESNETNKTNCVPAETNYVPTVTNCVPAESNCVPAETNCIQTKECISKMIGKEFGPNAKIINIVEQNAVGKGENYASELLRVQVDLELEDKTQKTLSYIYKGMSKSEESSLMLKMMGLLPREIDIYSKIIPKFVELYKNAGKTVEFGPKFYFARSDEEAFVLEDLKPKKFVNAKRQHGLNKNQIKSTLKKLAEYHAASAVIYEKEGYSDSLIQGPFTEELGKMMEAMNKPIVKLFIENLEKHESLRIYTDKFKNLLDAGMERFIKGMFPNYDEFNVLNHGDLWCNNIMFQYDENENIAKTYFVDLSTAKYGSPAQDLWYFLITSSSPELRIEKFDYFVKYYHEHLRENLKLLQYSKEPPKLVDLQIQLLRHSIWAVSTVQGVLPIMLLDPTELATIDNFMNESDAGIEFKKMAFTNPTFIKALETYLPWFDNKGILD